MARLVSVPCNSCRRKFGGHESFVRHFVPGSHQGQCRTESELRSKGYKPDRYGVWVRPKDAPPSASVGPQSVSGALALAPDERADWERHADAAAQLESKGDESQWEAAREYAEAVSSGAQQKEIAQRVGKSEAHVSFMVYLGKSPDLRGGGLSFAEAYAAAKNKKGAHVANNAGENEWYTPADYIAAAVSVLGGIDLDPASTFEANAVVGAERFFTREQDGLTQTWGGRVWMNPPYARPLIDGFCGKLAEEYAAGNVSQAITLTNNATETGWFHALAEVAAAICFPRGRVKFWHPEREAVPLQGQALCYLGEDLETFRKAFVQFGFAVIL